MKLAKVLGELTNNRLSSDFLYQLIDQAGQYERQKRQMKESKGGLEGADQVLSESPTMAWRALQGSLQNLASTAGETVMPVILPALQGLSGGLNSIATALQGMDATKLTAMGGALGALGAAGGLYGAYKVSTGLLALGTAGPSLQTAATMLQAAAARLGGGVPGVPGGKPGEAAKPVGAASWFAGALARVPVAAATLGTVLSPFAIRSSQDKALENVPGATQEEKILNQHRQRLQQNAAARREAYFEGLKGIGPQRDSNIPTFGEPDKARSIYDGFARGKYTRGGWSSKQFGGDAAKPAVDTSEMDAAKAKASETGQQIQSGLNVTAKPIVDASMIDALIAKGKEAIGVMQQLGASIGSASAAGASIGARVNAAKSDFGVVP